jgi:polyisoprenoid-binding protein YceI
MAYRRFARTTLSCSLAVGLFAVALSALTPGADAPLTIGSGKLSIAGTSNVHDWSASTTAVRVTKVQLGTQAVGAALWDEVVKPGALEAFEIAVAAGTLKSGKDGLDKNMYKALATTKYPDVTFRLSKLQAGAAAGAFKAAGTLTVAGVAKEITLDLTTQPRDGALLVKGSLALDMTEYGVKPPTAMLGMIKTHPKVTVTFEIVLAADAAAAR